MRKFGNTKEYAVGCSQELGTGWLEGPRQAIISDPFALIQVIYEVVIGLEIILIIFFCLCIIDTLNLLGNWGLMKGGVCMKSQLL